MRILLSSLVALVLFILYGVWKAKTTSSSLENTFTYLPYAIKRFGFLDGIKRTWQHYVSPSAQLFKYQQWRRERRKIDRREKKLYSRTVYCIDRDGDLYLVQCPQCRNSQGIWCHRPWDTLTEAQQEAGIKETPCDSCGGVLMRTHFHCGRCAIGIIVYTEDGLRKLFDHRDGNPPNPSVAVCDDSGKWHLGITADAPWWWSRREVYFDYNPENGKDAHGHHLYETFPNSPQQSPGGMQCEQAQPQGSL